MVTLKNELKIKRPRREVFEFLARPENLSLWNYYIRDVVKDTNGNNAEETVYHQFRKNDDQLFKITGYDHGRSLTLETIGDSKLQFRRTFILDEENNETRLNDRFDVDTTFPDIVERLMKNRMNNAVSENLEKLRELLEREETQLQDGRKITLKGQSGR
jgi:hypothetical protein